MSNNKKGFKGWIIAGITVLILAAFVALNFKTTYPYYYYYFKADHFNEGDKVYVGQAFYDIKNTSALGGFRMLRPLTFKDIDKMEVNKYERDTLIKSINPSLQPYVCNFPIYFKKSDMQKSKSAYIGTFVSTTFSNAVNAEYKYFDVFYAIKPNREVFHDENAHYTFHMPPGYTLADSNIYIGPFDLSKKEPEIFR